MTSLATNSDFTTIHSTYQARTNQQRRRISLNMLWPPPPAGDMTLPSQYARRESYTKNPMRRLCSERTNESQMLGNHGGITEGRDPSSRTHQIRSAAVKNVLATSLDDTNHLPLSSIRAQSVPITPGSVKSKRDWITRNSPETISIRSNRPKSPGNDTMTASTQVLQDWTTSPPFHAPRDTLSTRNEDFPSDGDDEESAAIAHSHVDQPSMPKCKLSTRDRWPPQPKEGRIGNDSQTAKPTAKMQVSEKVKLLRSNFEGSHGNGTPWAFRVAQEMYETMASPKSANNESQGNGARTTMKQSKKSLNTSPQPLHDSVLVSSDDGPTKYNDHLNKALQPTSDMSVVSDNVSSLASLPSVPISNRTLSKQEQTLPNPTIEVPSKVPLQGHLANIVLPSGQKLPPPKRRQYRRTNYRIRYEGPTLLRLRDVYGQLYEIPEVDERFVAEPKDSMVVMPQRRGESPYSGDGRKRPDIAAGVAGDVAPIRPGRNMDDSFSDNHDSFSSSDLTKVELDAMRSNNQAGEVSTLHRPNVWITPIKAGTSSRRWKVKRVWGMEVVDDEEVEHCVDHENLMDKIRLLFGVPQHFGKMSDESLVTSSTDKVATPWYIKRVFDIEGEIESSDDDESELVLSNSVMVEIMERIFDSEDFVFKRATQECATSSNLNATEPSNNSHCNHESNMSDQERILDSVETSTELLVDDGARNQQDHRIHEKSEQAMCAASLGMHMLPNTMTRPLQTISSTPQEYTCDDNTMDTTGVQATRKCSNIHNRNENTSLESRINQPIPKHCRPLVVHVVYRRHSTGEMLDKDPGGLSPTKDTRDFKSDSRKNCIEDPSPRLCDKGDDSRGAAPNARMTGSFAAKGRCLSLQIQSSTPQARKEMKMWWHE